MTHVLGIVLIALAAVAFGRLLLKPHAIVQRIAHPIIGFALLLLGSCLV